MTSQQIDFWVKVACILSVMWLGLIFMFSAINERFGWTDLFHPDRLGPASWCAGAGLTMIWAACLGLPWVLAASRK